MKQEEKMLFVEKYPASTFVSLLFLLCRNSNQKNINEQRNKTD
ncbi:hypothetical protein [Bernardetia sp.]|nr:hypothetical protein [Bernardetia sp.]